MCGMVGSLGKGGPSTLLIMVQPLPFFYPAHLLKRGITSNERGMAIMKFNLNDLNPGTYFEFADGTEGGVTIRVANTDVINKIEKKCTKRKFEFKRNQRFEVIEEDVEKRNSMLWDYVIVDWEGITDMDDNPIPCTRENKALLMQNSMKFSTFVGKCIEILNDQMEDYEGELEKNLLK